MAAELYHFWIAETSEHWRYTSAKASVVYGGNAYAALGIDYSLMRHNVEDDECVISAPLNTAPVTLLIAYAPVGTIHVDVMSLSGTRIFSGRAMSAKFNVDEYRHEVKCVSIGSYVEGDIPFRRFTKVCPYHLFDADCKVVRASHSVGFARNAATVTAAYVEHAALSVAAGAGYFLSGWISDGIEGVFIIKHTQSAGVGRVYLLNPFTQSAGAAFTVYAGCDYKAATCDGRFDNIHNFGGCPYVPDKNPSVDGF